MRRHRPKKKKINVERRSGYRINYVTGRKREKKKIRRREREGNQSRRRCRRR
jgi:hypothetical protein